MKDRNHVTREDVGRLERRAEQLRERIAARGGPNADTTSEAAELASLEIAIDTLDALRWRRSIDEPIPDAITEVAAVTVDEKDDVLLLRRHDHADWKCTCGCGRLIAGNRIYRWRPTERGRAVEDREDAPTVSVGSYRGRQRLAIIDDRIRYLTARVEELKRKGTPARYEKDELHALRWIRDIVISSGNHKPGA